MGSSSVSMSGDDLEIVERDPTGRYVRYDEILGEGASKTVYKAFDEDNGLEVAWSKVDIFDNILNSRKQLERLYSEAKLLKSLKHENVIRCYHSWVDNENKTFNMITELLTSGNLRDYRSKHGLLDNKVIKKWARQILTGLDYLHSHNPPIVHRDLKSENIFVNGNSGKVKIGDLGLATVLQHATAHSFIGTPEFIAPELYDEDYNQLVDIYSFGMCMLQMVTRELPYRECKNPAQVFKKVTSGIKPAALDKVVDPQIRQFIDKCLAPVTERWSATDLLNDPFLESGNSSPLSCSPSLTESVCSSISNSPHPMQVEKVTVTKTNIFKLQGKMQDKNSISMVHWITDLDGVGEKAEFVFFLQNDTIPSVIEEMAKELMLSAEDAPLIAQLMERLITELLPDFRCCQAEAKSCSQISCLTEDDLNLHSVSTTESPEEAEDQDAKELQPEIFGVRVPLSRSGFADLSNNESESSTHDNVCSNQVQKLEDNGIQTQTKYFDLNLDNVRKEKRKCPKNVAWKAVSSCLRKQLFQCWKQF